MWTYQPDVVSPPGETLSETLEALGMTQAELAERTGRPKKTINEIVKGKSAITPETALQFEKVLGIPARFWNNREAAYRDYLARQQEREGLEKDVSKLDHVPLKVLHRWIPEGRDRIETLRNIYSFFGVASWDTLEASTAGTMFRCSPKLEADRFALAAWLRKGWLEAQQIETAAYSADEFENALTAIRRLTAEVAARGDSIGAQELVAAIGKHCSPAGVAVCFVRELPRTHAFGATRWAATHKAIIQLSNRYKRDDIFWFTFFHEAAHVLKHGKKETFIECEGEKDGKERAADRFAADLLIPPDDWKAFVSSDDLTEQSIRAFARRIAIAPGIVVGRLQHEQMLGQSRLNHLKIKIESNNTAG